MDLRAGGNALDRGPSLVNLVGGNMRVFHGRDSLRLFLAQVIAGRRREGYGVFWAQGFFLLIIFRFRAGLSFIPLLLQILWDVIVDVREQLWGYLGGRIIRPVVSMDTKDVVCVGGGA